jgi:hypothetical protein
MTSSPAPADTRRLFLDTDSLRTWDTGIIQRFPRPEKLRVSGLEPGPPGSWDARVTTIYGSVLREGGLFKMWYCSMPDALSHTEGADHGLICYAESGDGYRWRKPDLRLAGQKTWPGNNLLSLPGFVMGVVPALPATGAKYLGCFVLMAPEADLPYAPEIRFSGIGTYILASDDGLRWRNTMDGYVLSHGDVAGLVADPLANRYLFYQKVGLIHGLDTRRSFIGLASPDGRTWSNRLQHEWNECFVCDDYDDLQAAQRGFRIADTYGVAVYRAGNLYVAVEDVFDISSPLRFQFAQNPNGLCHFRLAFSHNAMNWRYPKGRPEWMSTGAPGEFDAGFMVPASTFLECDDHLLLYYGGSRYDHGWCINTDFALRTDVPLEDQRNSAEIGLARIRKDRFASLAATYRGRFDLEAGPRGGETLRINALCPRGRVRVEISEAGKKEPLPGFSLDDCLPITGDSTGAEVRFRGAQVGSIAKDLPLFLRFEVERGEVFGYEWGAER